MAFLVSYIVRTLDRSRCVAVVMTTNNKHHGEHTLLDHPCSS